MKRVKVKKGKSKDIIKPEPRVAPEDEKENPFDFGGLPKRDLKKNLGCG